jgi:hypothetical protein
MSLSDAYRAARALEAIENYERADDPLSGRSEFSQEDAKAEMGLAYEDNTFWDMVISRPNDFWDAKISLYEVALSEWVARVPGLYWSPGSQDLRDLATQAIEQRSEGWTIYQPIGKSSKVLGGVGTLKFPPDQQGHRLVTLSSGLNASSGVPALIFPEVWEHLGLREGDVCQVKGIWRKMSTSWAERFPSIKGIPRGYIVIEAPEQMEVVVRDAPIQFHPCTVMEYSKGGARLYDFVYCTTDTQVKNYRVTLEKFFSEYKNREGRYGQYLLAPDINEQLFEAKYQSPEALRLAPGERAHMELLTARVRRDSFRDQDIGQIIELLSRNYDNVSLQTLSAHIEIAPSLWFIDGTAANSVDQLLNICLERNKVEELLDAIGRDYPKLITAGG